MLVPGVLHTYSVSLVSVLFTGLYSGPYCGSIIPGVERLLNDYMLQTGVVEDGVFATAVNSHQRWESYSEMGSCTHRD